MQDSEFCNVKYFNVQYVTQAAGEVVYQCGSLVPMLQLGAGGHRQGSSGCLAIVTGPAHCQCEAVAAGSWALLPQWWLRSSCIPQGLESLEMCDWIHVFPLVDALA